MGHRVLVVDGEVRHRNQTRRALGRAGFLTMERESGAAAVAEAPALQPDVVVVCADASEPHAISVCNRFSLEADAPVVVHATAADDAFMLRCFDAGATDVIERATPEPLLVARVRAHARQHVSRAVTAEHVISAGGLLLNLDTRACSLGDVALVLTRAEFELVYELMRYPGHVIPRAVLLGSLPHAGANPRLLETHMSRIRGKIRCAGGPELIHAVRGVGYRFEALT